MMNARAGGGGAHAVAGTEPWGPSRFCAAFSGKRKFAPMPTETGEHLRELVTALAVRVEAIEHRLNTSMLRREDLAALSRILPALAGALGSEMFLASEAVSSENAALALVLAGMNARRLGRLLRRGEGISIEGYVVHAQGAESGAMLWEVHRAP
jgi:hypothetical protein